MTLRQILEKFHGVVDQITASIGEVVGVDQANANLEDPCLCLALDAGQEWESSIKGKNNVTKQWQ